MKPQFFTLAACVFAVLATGSVASPALQFQFPAPAEETARRQEDLASTRIAFGPFADGKMATEQAVGSLHQTAWRLDLPRASTLDLMNTLRTQVIAAGFVPQFECETDDCGGFDFRYSNNILPEPEMHIDLGDFRYLVAERPGSQGKEYLSLMVSRSPQQGYVQVTQVGSSVPPKQAEPSAVIAMAAPVAASAAKPEVLSLRQSEATEVSKTLDLGLPLVLEDLVFDSGSSTLAEGAYPSLDELHTWLKANPDKGITLVGHTDASGGLTANIALSRKRAESVRAFMLHNFDIPAASVTADGVGPLAPRASNLDEAGRQQNRRVEVLPTSTQ